MPSKALDTYRKKAILKLKNNPRYSFRLYFKIHGLFKSIFLIFLPIIRCDKALFGEAEK